MLETQETRVQSLGQEDTLEEGMATHSSILVCAQSCLTLCDPMDCSSPGSSVHRIFQARILEWVAISSPGNFLTQGSNLHLLYLADGFFTTEPLALKYLLSFGLALHSLTLL